MVKLLPSKHRRAVWSKSIKGFWDEYKQNRIGLVGLIFVLIYVFTAIFAPWLAPYDPLRASGLAQGFAMPAWVTIFPGFEDIPPTMELPLNWSETEPLLGPMEAIETGRNLVVEYNGTELQTANFTSSFYYGYDAPNKFIVLFTQAYIEKVENAQYIIELFISNPAGNEFPLWLSYLGPEPEFSSDEKGVLQEGLYSDNLQKNVLDILKAHPLSKAKGGLINAPRDLFFTETGTYTLRLHIKVKPEEGTAEEGIARIQFLNGRLKIMGRVHGLLGADKMGADIFSQLIYGSQISMAVGLASAVMSTSIGIAVGILSGYLGGVVDESLMRLVDILMCIPVLPLLLGLIVIFGTSIWYLVLLIAVFGWLGLSRIIRSRVLSLKELPFIESARASGGTSLYIMFRHMLPNIVPVSMASLVLSVPAAILTEAGISFIGLGDPTTPSWGRMLNLAFSTGAFSRLAWWWIIPPGAAITILTLSFVFMAFAVDAIVNPRLRRRR